MTASPVKLSPRARELLRRLDFATKDRDGLPISLYTPAGLELARHGCMIRRTQGNPRLASITFFGQLVLDAAEV